MKIKRMVIGLLCMLMVGMSLSGCGNKTDSAYKGELKPVKLTWYITGTQEQPDMNEVLEAANKIIGKEINATLDFRFVSFSGYDQKMNMVISTKENYDLCWTSVGTNDYYNNIAKKAFYPVDDLLKKYGKNTYDGLPEKIWEAAKVKGKTYAIINHQVMSTAYGYQAQRKVVDKSGIAFDSVTNYHELEPLLQSAKENFPDLSPMYIDKTTAPFTSYLQMFGLESVGSGTIPGAVRTSDGDYKVINQYETEEFKDFIATLRDWYKKGYINQDSATSEDKAAKVNVGLVAIEFPTAMTQDSTDDSRIGLTKGKGTDKYLKRFTNNSIPTDRALATMTAISAQSKNPERAMMLIELINTNHDLYNLICRGIEGKHFKKVNKVDQDGVPIQIELPDESGYKPNTSWLFGHATNEWRADNEGNVEVWKKCNEEAEIGMMFGFPFDATPVKNEIALCSSVVDEYLSGLCSGSMEIEDRYDEFLKKLKLAGGDMIISEKQKQVNAWKASK